MNFTIGHYKQVTKETEGGGGIKCLRNFHGEIPWHFSILIRHFE